MSAINDFAHLLEDTEVMRQMIKDLKEEPARLLGNICREYKRRGQLPVPDYTLQLVGYMGETALKALLSAGLITRQSGGANALYLYEPTMEGLRQYETLEADGFYKKK